MAVNPITSDDLTIDMKSLLSIPVGDRVQAAASDPGFAQALMQSLTPIQLAKAFPDYYRRELPDVSNFILANRYLDSGGVFNQRGGGAYGDQRAGYGGEAALDQTRPRLPGKQSQVEKSKVQQILESAEIFGTATGKTGVTSAIQDQRGYIISTADTSLSPAQRALLDTIAVGNATKDQYYWESPNYNTIVNGGTFTDFSDHPRVFGTSASTAAGRYQFTKSTWDEEREKYNKKFPDNPITDFSPLNQDRLALFLAEQRYRNNTGRDLNADLANPPENMGELIKVGLGKGPVNLTWEIFVKKSAQQAGDAFAANLARNQGYLDQEIEAEAKKKEGIEEQIVATPELMKSFENDPDVQKFFADKPEMAIKVQEAINSGKTSIEKISNIVKTKKIDSAIQSTLDKQIDVNTLAEGDPRKYYRNNTAIGEDDEIWKYLHPDLVRDKDRILASGKIRTGALLSADAVFRHAASQGIPMRVALEGGADSHSANHLHDGVGESLDIKPGRRDAQGRDIDGGNTWESYKVNPAEYAAVSAAAIQSIGGVARTGVSFNSSGMHTQDTGGEGLGIHEEQGGMSWVYGQDLIGAGQGGEFRNKVQSGAFGKELGGYVNSLYPESKKEDAATAIADTSSQRVFIGDSIAEGMRTSAKGEGNTKVGRKPGEVLSEMEKMGLDYFKGKEVILSTGLSNNTEDLESVRKQMEFLKQSGANVKIAGMSNSREDLAPGNQQLQGLASEYGYQFMGGYDAGKDKVHPTDYGSYLASATPVKEEVKAYQFGGTPTLQDDEDLTAVGPDGKPRFKFNSGEGLYVKPEANEYADDKINELSDRVDKMSETKQSTNQREMPTSGPTPDPRWVDKVASAYRPSGTQQRAFNRAQFRSEGKHVGDRGSPNIA